MTMEAEAKTLIKEIFAGLESEVKNLVFKIFPQRVRLLNSLLSKSDFKIVFYDAKFISPIPIIVKTDYNVVDGEKIPNNDSDLNNVNPERELITSNNKLMDFIDIVKFHISQSMEDMKAIKSWLSISITSITKLSACRFEVGELELVLEDIHKIERTLHSFGLPLAAYHENRARILTLILGYPDIEDYQKCLAVHDEQLKISAICMMSEIRDSYVTILNCMIKNLDKVPQTNNS